MRVEALALWCGANFLRSRWSLFRDPACRSAGVVVRCKFATSPMNPPQGSCVSKRWRCSAVQILYVPDEPCSVSDLKKSLAAPRKIRRLAAPWKKSRQDERKLRLQHVAASGGRLKHRLPYTHADENIPDPCSPLCRSFRDCVLGRRCYVRKQLYVVATLSTENFV